MLEGKDSHLWLKIIKEIHDQPVVGHLETKQMLNMICWHYYWPGMRKEVEPYLRNCYMCKCAKASWDAYNSLLQSLPVPEKLWVDLTIDFVVGLPKSQGFDAILMVIDQFLKKKHYILCTENDNGTSAKITAGLFLRHVWCYYSLPISLTSDWGLHFTFKMWDLLCKLLGIKAKLSTVWHPETDGQSEIANQEIERYTQSYINHF